MLAECELMYFTASMSATSDYDIRMMERLMGLSLSAIPTALVATLSTASVLENSP